MARYWIGGTGSWDASNTANWSTSSGGSSGASVPGTSDDVIFDSSSSTSNAAYTVTINATANCADLTVGGPGAGNKVTFAGVSLLNIFGSLNLTGGTAGITRTFLGQITFKATSAGKTITCNGVTLSSSLVFNGVGGSWQLQDDLSMPTGGNPIQLTNGTLDTNGKTVTFFRLQLAAGTKSLTLGSSTLVLIGSSGTPWDVITNASGFTLNAGTSTIQYTDTSSNAVAFSGNGLTYNNVWFARGVSTGTITIAGSNTLNSFKDDGSVAHSLIFTVGTTQTMASFNVSGSVGNLITITSTTTGTHSLSIPTGTIKSNYLNVQHSIAAGGATWYAGANSVNNQAVTTAGSGWLFTAPPASPFLGFFLMSNKGLAN